MVCVLENDLIRVSISTRGAEVQSFILKDSKTEYMWQGNAEIWAGRAPLVFPIVGRYKNNEYTSQRKTYHMEANGFGKSSEFTVIEHVTDKIVFSLRHSESTLQMYPFKFELQIGYSLSGTTLTKMHAMINLDNKALYYSIGGHDSYNLCLEEGEVFEDYYLDFGNLDKLEPLKRDENYYILKETYVVPLDDGKLPLDMQVFKKGALVCHDLPVKNVVLRSKKSSRAISVEFADFKTLGIWTKYLKKPANYICLEPWSTLPDCAYLGNEIEEKVDIRKVLPGEKDSISFSVTIR